MPTTIQISPVRIEDTERWCDVCDEETLHVSTLTFLTENPLDKFDQLECEICMLSWEWN